jgi:hypothetical protein
MSSLTLFARRLKTLILLQWMLLTVKSEDLLTGPLRLMTRWSSLKFEILGLFQG